MEPELLPLRAGPLSLWWQPCDGMVRYVCAAGVELLRGITAPVRADDWKTVPPRLTNVLIDHSADSFCVEFDANCEAPGIAYTWHGEYTGSAKGEVICRFHGTALSDFQSNRIGFCVLHPAGVSGAPVVVEHTDGRLESAHLPVEISPHQPFRDVRGLVVTNAPGLELAVRLEGEDFEMEDQRNWLDASFKTYCIPLDRPRPTWVRTGDEMKQRVTLRVLEAHGVPWVSMAQPPELACPSGGVIPALGLAWPMDDGQALSAGERRQLAAMALDHLRVDVDHPERIQAAEVGIKEASEAGCALEIAVHVDDQNIRETSAWVRGFSGNVARWIVVERGAAALRSCRWVDAVRDWSGGHAPVVAGSDVQFTEMNRTRPPGTGLDGVAFAMCPQVHAFDERSIRETLTTIPTVVMQARSFIGGGPAHVGVVTLRPEGRCTALEDPRLSSAFGAEWTRDAIAALGAGGAASATFYTVRGVLAAPRLAAVFANRSPRP